MQFVCDGLPTIILSHPVKQDQVPSIKVKGGYCSLSLRMMKAIWRHIRLRKGFVNIEPLSHGGGPPLLHGVCTACRSGWTCG